ncbi:MFS transporter [Corynebacterium breve]|uniref:MFS transporter n=1 Tax=Corynebacterium breve TaxID=3049799 RepID=A0ABY8VDK8_9CORY|nr:MFS transporter [Corynebacterium breve]WIM67026.1 MFS transporter [Corynebacterium breve]
MSYPDPREVVTRKALIVWGTAVLAYIIAILGRTSFGVAGVEAIDRFGVDASRIAVFTAVQVGVYAFCQIPMGLGIDRFGPRRMLVAGALVMAIGQVILGFTTNYWVAIFARILIGGGDASAFLSVMRILPYWFPIKKTPLFTQFSASLGQFGQFLSAVPFLWLLNAQGWTIAFTSLGAIGVLLCIAIWVAVEDAPEGASATKTERVSLGYSLKTVFTSATCWQAFFIHYMSMLSGILFALLWGLPLMTLGMGLSTSTAGMVLMIFSLVTMCAGPVMGWVSTRAGSTRDTVAIILAIFHFIVWAIFFSSEEPRGLVAVIMVNVVMAFLTLSSNYGFDQVRERLPKSVVATGTGMGNMGAFLAAMVASQVVGLLLDHSSHGNAFTWADFRYAWVAVFIIWAIGIIGAIVSGRMIARSAKKAEHHVVIVDEQAPTNDD